MEINEAEEQNKNKRGKRKKGIKENREMRTNERPTQH